MPRAKAPSFNAHDLRLDLSAAFALAPRRAIDPMVRKRVGSGGVLLNLA
jgi:hypothetical protein